LRQKKEKALRAFLSRSPPLLTAPAHCLDALRAPKALGACATGQTDLRPVFWVGRFSDFVGLGKLFTNLKIPSAFLKLER
jgi:hypothetical protein